MSFSESELEEHCRNILRQRKIKDRVIVLCEGKVFKEPDGRPSPQTYRRMEAWPDANFYRACLPKTWREYVPHFFNCGDRSNVLNTYAQLQSLQTENTLDLYYQPRSIFVLVDLDLSSAKISGDYRFQETGAIFFNLYEKARVNLNNIDHHQIWTTGLIHKEAYFLIPELQSLFDNLFDNGANSPQFQGHPLQLDLLYEAIAQNLHTDGNLNQNFATATTYLSYMDGLDFTDSNTLSQSWLAAFSKAKSSQNSERQRELAIALLTISPVKTCWNTDIQPTSTYPLSQQQTRDVWARAIATQFFAQQPETAVHLHIPCFGAKLRQVSHVGA